MQNSFNLSLLQWNVLADGMEHRLPRWGNALAEGSRGHRVIQRVLFHAPDLFCAQEVNKFQNMCDTLQHHDYVGAYLQKAKGHGSSPDGTAIFWKKSKFTLIDKLELKGLKGWNQVCLALILCSVESGFTFSVATTHLKAFQNPKDEKTRLAQVLQFNSAIETWIKQFSVDLHFFVGDLNSSANKIPNSWMGKVPRKLEQLGYLSSYHSYEWEDVGVPFSKTDMVSFCEGGEQELYDYIFYKPFKSTNLHVDYCEPLYIRKRSPSVTDHYPSDHLPLFVKFSITNEIRK